MARQPRLMPNGKWQAIAEHPHTGQYKTKVFKLKTHARTWAEELESRWRAGTGQEVFNDRATVGAWIDEWLHSRDVDPNTAMKEASHIRNHIRPRWGTTPILRVTRNEVKAWAKEMREAGVGLPTIHGAVSLFGTILKAAVEEERLAKNPAARIPLPPIPQKPPMFWTRAQAKLIVAELPEPWDIGVSLCLWGGLRPGEMLGLHGRGVDWTGQRIHVMDVWTPRGLREHPKSTKSFRDVPIPDHLMDPMLALTVGRPKDELVFKGARGKPMALGNFRYRFFDPAVARAGACEAHRWEGEQDPACRGCKLTWLPGRPCPEHRVAVAAADAACKDCTPVPAGTPHSLRHTAASWLVQDGVDLYRVQDLLGHESFRTTQRYAHLAPDRHAKIREVWASWDNEAEDI